MFKDYDLVSEYKHETGRRAIVLKRIKANFESGQYLVRFLFGENERELKYHWTEKAAKESALDWCLRDLLPCSKLARAT